MDEMVEMREYREEIMRFKELGREAGVNAEGDSSSGSTSASSSSSSEGKSPSLALDDGSGTPVTRSHSIMSSSSSSSADGEDVEDKEGTAVSQAEAIAMFQQLLMMRSNGESASSPASESAGSIGGGGGGGGGLSLLDPPTGPSTSGSAGARPVCNLPDHPVHAGCTAVCVFIHGKKLVCANAGDSRAVIARKGGRAEPLSEDHKPEQEG